MVRDSLPSTVVYFFLSQHTSRNEICVSVGTVSQPLYDFFVTRYLDTFVIVGGTTDGWPWMTDVIQVYILKKTGHQFTKKLQYLCL